MPPTHQPLVQEGFLGHLGGIGVRRTSEGVETCLVVGAEHLNPNGTVHGGVLLTLLDYTLGVSVENALGEAARHPTTISLTTHFLAGADHSHLLRGTATILRQTRSLSFAQGRITSGDRVVAAADAVFKNPPPA
jgi:uncharacterized protein (TIGR00369 family)